MPLTAGAHLGPYEILAALGAGGMGEVYRARDTKLDRDVAIKVLPELFIADPERVARFQREAKTLAALNHPHIGGITVSKMVVESMRWCWSWWKARRWQTGSPKDRFHSTRRCRLPARSPRRSKRPTSRGSSTAI